MDARGPQLVVVLVPAAQAFTVLTAQYSVAVLHLAEPHGKVSQTFGVLEADAEGAALADAVGAGVSFTRELATPSFGVECSDDEQPAVATSASHMPRLMRGRRGGGAACAIAAPQNGHAESLAFTRH